MRQTETIEQNNRSLELNRMIRTAALSVDPRGRISTLAARAGLDPETIRRSIRIGYFTVGSASALELTFGKELLPKDKLIEKPLEA